MRGRIDEPDRRLRTNTPLICASGREGLSLGGGGRWQVSGWGDCPESACEPAGAFGPSRFVSWLGWLP